MCIYEIAVIVGEDGRTVSLTGPGTVVIFRRIDAIWQRERIFPFSLEHVNGLPGLRRNVAELVAFLGECRTFVAQSARGAISFELEKVRCHVWEITGIPEEFLDSVCLEIKEEQEVIPPSVAVDAVIPIPFETVPGKFTVSITEIQRKRSGVSSKQVLQQFLRRGNFTELEILCEHLPPWIGVEMEFLGIQIETGHNDLNEIRVLLKKQN
ncbi:MAG: Fe-only nitrogenase accessory AnfO family protein [Methanoregula sp.]|jgi:Fe-only nitrogenase accessory protein AnfO